jgi:hypothetical protein
MRQNRSEITVVQREGHDDKVLEAGQQLAVVADRRRVQHGDQSSTQKGKPFL